MVFVKHRLIRYAQIGLIAAAKVFQPYLVGEQDSQLVNDRPSSHWCASLNYWFASIDAFVSALNTHSMMKAGCCNGRLFLTTSFSGRASSNNGFQSTHLHLFRHSRNGCRQSSPNRIGVTLRANCRCSCCVLVSLMNE
jgi:hypothetical protein